MKTTHKILSIICAAFIGLSFLTLPTYATADPGGGGGGGSTPKNTEICDSNVADEVKEAAGCKGNADAVPGIIENILLSIIVVVGIIAVIFIVIGGVNFMTSTGDPGKVKKAKDTILYALIGLIICALAFAIVNWTIGVINNS